MRVVDFRARANTPEADAYRAPRIDDIERLGLTYPGGGRAWYRAPTETLESFVERLDSAGIDSVVFVGRNRASSPGWPLTNEFVAEATHRYPGRIIGFAGIDAQDLRAAPREVERAIGELGLYGANLDPFQIDACADDRRFDGVYTMCAELQVPIIVTFGALPGVPARLRNGPLALDAVAQRFPNLTIIACHGGWPFTSDMVAVAWRNPNVYFENSFYHFTPGSESLVGAANHFIADKMLYASAYPFAPLEETLRDFTSLSFEPEALEKVLGGNASRILNLPT